MYATGITVYRASRDVSCGARTERCENDGSRSVDVLNGNAAVLRRRPPRRTDVRDRSPTTSPAVPYCTVGEMTSRDRGTSVDRGTTE